MLEQYERVGREVLPHFVGERSGVDLEPAL